MTPCLWKRGRSIIIDKRKKNRCPAPQSIPAKFSPTSCTSWKSRRPNYRDSSPYRISQIIQGKRAITGDTALRLGHWFQTSAQFWLNLQSAYALRVATDQVGREVAALPTKAARRRAGG
jgi:hypothetical protein